MRDPLSPNGRPNSNALDHELLIASLDSPDHRFNYECLLKAYFYNLVSAHFSGQREPPTSVEWEHYFASLCDASPRDGNPSVRPSTYFELERARELRSAIRDWLHDCHPADAGAILSGAFLSHTRIVRTQSDSPLLAMLIETRNRNGHSLLSVDGVLYNTGEFSGVSILAIEDPGSSGSPFAIQTLISRPVWESFLRDLTSTMSSDEMKRRLPLLHRRLRSDLAARLKIESDRPYYLDRGDDSHTYYGDQMLTTNEVKSISPAPPRPYSWHHFKIETTAGAQYDWLLYYSERYATIESMLLRPESQRSL